MVCAAVLVNDHIVCSARHYDKVMVAQMDTINEAYSGANVIQGFIDQHGVFLTREEAYVVARDAGQVRDVGVGVGEILISEDLY